MHRQFHSITSCALAVMSCCIAASFTSAQDRKLTAREVTVALFNSPQNQRPDFSKKDLSRLDMANLDFKGTQLVAADLFGANLSESNFTRADLSGARIDRATITRAKFENANLTGATVLRPNIFSSLESDPLERPSFDKANLTNGHLSGNLQGVSFHGANLAKATFGAKDPRSEELITARVELRYCDFSDANLQGAVLRNNSAPYASFRNANLKDADLSNSDLTMADFRGADISGANFTGAKIDAAKFDSVKGRVSAIGLQ